MKKILCLLLALLMVFTLFACSSTKEPTGDNTDSTADTPDVTEDTPFTGLEMEWTEQDEMFKSIAGTTITKIGNPADLDEWSLQVHQEFMERYDVKINWLNMTYDEYTSKLPQLVATGNAPDTAVMTDATSLAFMYQGLCAPIDEYLDLDDPYWDHDVLEAYKMDGHYYAVNTNEVETFFVYYNRTLFEELALDDPYELYMNGEWTYDKLREIAQKATIYEDDNTTVKTYGIGTHAREVFVLANGGKFIDYDEANNTYVSTLKDKATITGLNFLRDLIADGSMNPSIQGFTEFPGRKIAMFVERPMNAIGNYDLLNTMEDEIGIVPFPQGPDTDVTYAPSIFVTNFVPTNCKNPLGGMAWNYFWARRLAEGAEERDEAWVYRNSKMMNEEHESIINDYLTGATKLSSKMDSLVGWSTNYRETFWADLIWQQKSAEEVAAAMENVLNNALKDTVG